MLLLTLLATLSRAEADPSEGVRLGVCAGASSHCQLAQVKLGYKKDRMAFILGIGSLSLSATGQYYLYSPALHTRQFISASWTPIAYPGVVIGFDSSVEAFWISSIGAAYGADFHLFKKRRFVLTPRVGVDVNTKSSALGTGSQNGINPSLSLDMSLAF